MISQETIDEVVRTLREESLDSGLQGRLRSRFEDIHFTLCLEDELTPGPRAVAEEMRFNLYLVDGRGHCTTFTNYLENATGLVIAEVEAEEA